jgi:hypothetical protein
MPPAHLHQATTDGGCDDLGQCIGGPAQGLQGPGCGLQEVNGNSSYLSHLVIINPPSPIRSSKDRTLAAP